MTNSKEVCTSFDDILTIVGNDGPFQRRFNILFNFFLVLFTTMPYFNLVIALSIPEHWCNVSGRELTNYTADEWKMYTIPKEYDTRGRDSYSKCKMFNLTKLTKFEDFTGNRTEEFEIMDCQHGWEYNKTWYTKTAVSQENWVCEKQLYVSNTFAFCRIGELVGSLVAGQLGDTIGRKPVFFVTLVALLVGKLSSTFTAGIFPLFLTAAVVGSLTSTAVFSSPLIIAMEISKDDDRAHIAMLQSLGWTSGLALMPFVMWAVGDWIYFMIITTLPCSIFLFLNRYVIESPRWLMSRGKISRCMKELEKIAKVNRTKLPEDAVLTLTTASKNAEKVYGVMSLFSHWRIAKNTTCILMCWVITALSYFTLILNTSNLGGNPFLNFFYQGLAELPAYVIGRYSCDYLGRRWTQIGAFLVTAAGCLPLIILINTPSFEWLATALAVFLKFSICFAFYGVNLHSLEIYPTCLRQTGMSLGAMSANAIGILGPYIVYLGTTIDARYPYIILAILGVFAACCGFALPETLHHKLPETLAEAQVFGNDQKYFNIPKKRNEFEPVKT